MKTKLFPFIVAAALAVCVSQARGQGITYTAFLDGPTEPSPSLGTGFVTLDFDPDNNFMRLQVTFTNLTGNSSVAHVHAPTAVPFAGTAGVATQTPSFAGFPAGVKFGSYSNTFDTSQSSTWNSAYITANGGTTELAEAAFGNALAEGRSYFNLHTSEFPGGEIRGFLVPVPEPSTIALAVIGGAGVLAVSRMNRRKS